jgi:hypothetical protein
MSRLHPFDLVFGGTSDSWFDPVRSEAEREGRDPADPATFAAMQSVQEILRQLAGADTGTAEPAQMGEYVALLFAAFAYWANGSQTVDVDRTRLDAAIAAEPKDGPIPGNHPCYVRLPERWAWGQVTEGAPHEPLDGFFIARAHRGDWCVVAVLGLRADRAGFSQVAVTASPDDVARAPGQVRQPPFAPLMEGGSRAGFHSIASMAELLMLAHLALRLAAE